MHKVDISFTPVCTSCGNELKTYGTQTSPDFLPKNPFDKEKTWALKDQRVFVAACDKCYKFIGADHE